MITRVLSALLLFLSSLSYAQTTLEDNPAHKTNGCGTDGWGLLVPNKTIISQCNFLPACNEHDVCYGRCLKGGPLSGPTCTNDSERMARKKVCDIRLKEDIKFFNSNRKICGLYAAMYEWAVTSFGKSAFHGVTANSGSTEALSALLAYIENNPTSFNISETERVFENLNQENQSHSYFVTFDQSSATLKIVFFDSNDKLVKEIYLKGQK